MPATYAQELDILDSALKLQPRPKRKSPKALRAAQANEIQLQAREPVAVSAAPLPRPRPAANANVEDEGEGAAADDQDYDFEDYDPVCPTFADDENPFAAGECIFTAPSVQHCILDFFEEVAVAEKGATGYRNPVFRVAAVVSADVGEKDDDEDDAALKSPEEPPVKIELKLKRAELAHMRASLASTSRTDPLLAAGRCNLEQRIRAKEAEVKGWERKVLAAGAFGPGEGEEVRREAEREALELKRREREEREKENKGTGWEKVDLGPKVKFAGTVVERELLRKAGLDGVEEMEVREVAEGVGRLELDGDGE